jgi:hypothetical protein
MTDNDDDAEFDRLMQAKVDGQPGAQEALDALTARRIAEADAERAGIVEAFGGDPVVGTVVEDGGTLQRPPGHFDVGSASVTTPSGQVIDEEELRRHMHPPRT